MIDLYALWIINGRGQVNWKDSTGLGSFIDTLHESDTHAHRHKYKRKKKPSELDIHLLFYHIQMLSIIHNSAEMKVEKEPKLIKRIVAIMAKL